MRIIVSSPGMGREVAHMSENYIRRQYKDHVSSKLKIARPERFRYILSLIDYQ